jgi:DUF4097 and DUF4098 domain-containing protein YvlB
LNFPSLAHFYYVSAISLLFRVTFDIWQHMNYSLNNKWVAELFPPNFKEVRKMKIAIKVLLMLILAISSIFLVSCGSGKSVNSGPNVDNTNFKAEADFLFPIEVADQTLLRLTGINGSITITGRADFDSVIIAGTRRVYSESLEDAEDHLELLDVSVHEMTDEINVRTIQPDETYGRNYEVDYIITLPENFVITTSSVNGAVEVDLIANDVTISNVNGQITLDHISGNVSVNLVNGHIAGNVTLPLEGTLIMSIVNGAIGLNIPETTSAEFAASVVNGNILISDLDLHDEVITNSSVSGTLGDGDGQITLNTVNGNIAVGSF